MLIAMAIHPNTILSLPVCYLGNSTEIGRDEQGPISFHPYSQSLPVCKGGDMQAGASTALHQTPWSIRCQVVQEAGYLIPSHF